MFNLPCPSLREFGLQTVQLWRHPDRKLKSLEEVKPGSLAGKMGVVIDLVTRLPVEIWFQENPSASDTRFEENLLQLVSAKTLLLLDRGFYHFQFWQKLIDKGIHANYSH